MAPPRSPRIDRVGHRQELLDAGVHHLARLDCGGKVTLRRGQERRPQRGNQRRRPERHPRKCKVTASTSSRLTQGKLDFLPSSHKPVVLTRVSDHVGVGIVDTDHLVLPALERFDACGRDLLGLHLWLFVELDLIRRHLGVGRVLFISS